MPKTADFALTAEWWFSPVSTRIDSLFIAKDKTKRYWVLWLKWFDDNWLKYEERIINAIPSNDENNVNKAAIELIIKFWSEEMDNGSLSYGPEFISQLGIIDENDMKDIIKKVWSI